MLSATITPVNVGGGAIIRIVGAQGPITLTRYDPQYSNTYTLLDGVPDVPVYIDMGDMAPEPLQSGVGYVYSLSDTVTTIQFTLVLPSAPVIGATYDNLIHMLQRIAEATIQNINFPRSPSGAQDPIKKAQIYIQPPMSENIKYPAIFINQEMLRMEEIPVGATNQGQQKLINADKLTGDFSNLTGDALNLRGEVSPNLHGTVSVYLSGTIHPELYGEISSQLLGTLSPDLKGEISIKLWGNLSPKLRGDITGIFGNVSLALTGEIAPDLCGDISGLWGTISPDLHGDISNLWGTLSPEFKGTISPDLQGNVTNICFDVTGLAGKIWENL